MSMTTRFVEIVTLTRAHVAMHREHLQSWGRNCQNYVETIGRNRADNAAQFKVLLPTEVRLPATQVHGKYTNGGVISS